MLVYSFSLLMKESFEIAFRQHGLVSEAESLADGIPGRRDWWQMVWTIWATKTLWLLVLRVEKKEEDNFFPSVASLSTENILAELSLIKDIQLFTARKTENGAFAIKLQKTRSPGTIQT